MDRSKTMFVDTKSAMSFLKGSLLFAMSLGAQELFHTNVWKWLFEKHPRFACLFFKELRTKSFEVTREEDHRDISIWLNKGHPEREKVFVIENKIKALPCKDQLERYCAKIIGKGRAKNEYRFGGGVITGIIKPKWNLGRWTFMRYAEIADGIAAVLQEVRGTMPEMESVSEYVRIIHALVCVIEGFLSRNKDRWAVFDDCNDERDVGLADVCLKLTTEAFKEYLSDRKEFIALSKKCPRGWSFDIKTGFSNCTSLIDVDFTRDDARIGIQIQDKSYRFFFCGAGRCSSTVYERALKMGWLSSDWGKNHPKGNRKDKRYKQFKISTVGFFVYQDKQLEERDFDVVGSMLECDLQNLVQLLQRHD